ncbi:putative phage tail protein [Clostridium sp. YIM B02500]|uniref:putative phage tail protein n=1 Tax=Clostridium sp. YIM B02500 TaxID=2910681 RepID=UPI001EEE8081|nr:putative phage tail protein [Clostridium sp. YIM B02500]
MDKNTLLAYQPDYYKSSKVMEQLNNANATELNLLNQSLELVRSNYDTNTADSNTLSRYEKEFNIKVSPSDSLDFRRSRINSRILGQGAFSVQMIKDIAKAYPNGEILVTLNLSSFQFTIKFISVIGTPPNLTDFQNAIEDVKPAYLKANYEFSYLLVEDVNSMTIENLNNTVINKFAF